MGPVGRHVPVMLQQVLEYLSPGPGQIVVDATVGAGGHAAAMAERVGASGLLVALDRDPEMLELARRRPWPCRVVWLCGNFADLDRMLAEAELAPVDAVLMDLGVCSDQLDDPQRGMSLSRPGPLDMRFNRAAGQPAAQLVNRLSREQLADLFFRYGEERHSRRIARAIVSARQRGPINRTDVLAEIVRRALGSLGRRQRIDPATRVFQALRIAVNDELASLERGLESVAAVLRPGGRAVVISFHSLEERIVKRAFQRRDVWEPLTPKPLRPDRAEVRANPRARSAKLRAAKRLQHS